VQKGWRGSLGVSLGGRRFSPRERLAGTEPVPCVRNSQWLAIGLTVHIEVGLASSCPRVFCPLRRCIEERERLACCASRHAKILQLALVEMHLPVTDCVFYCKGRCTVIINEYYPSCLISWCLARSSSVACMRCTALRAKSPVYACLACHGYVWPPFGGGRDGQGQGPEAVLQSTATSLGDAGEREASGSWLGPRWRRGDPVFDCRSGSCDSPGSLT
jgi:hypothetical protein